MDDQGKCLFHSGQVEWKRQNQFASRFGQLVELLDQFDDESYYNFAEFVFVGNERAGGSYALHISDKVFRKHAYFTGALFLDPFELVQVDFPDGVSFDKAIFRRDLAVEHAKIRGIFCGQTKFTGKVTFKEVDLESFVLFSDAVFDDPSNSSIVYFKNSRFQGTTDFSDARFTLGEQAVVSFEKVQFEDVVVFRGTHFNCQVDFTDVTFADKAEFIDTHFDMVHSTARYRGTAVEFNRITVTARGALSFISTDRHRKMFNHDVDINFKDDPAGPVRFENVNFKLLTASSKERLTQLARLGHVEIGSGCIKYRHQTDIETVSVSDGNGALVLDLCSTFANYFTASNGLNLGFEVVERDKTKVSFFYFTDENISEDTFFERLKKTKQSLWELLSISSEDQLLALEGAVGPTWKQNESGVINAVDAISTLMGTFFRVGARIALGRWTESDTAALLNAIPLNQEGATVRAANLHRQLKDRYTRGRLVDLSGQLNRQLFLEDKVAALDQTVRVLADKTHDLQNKIKIVFLAANPIDTSPLRVGEEMRQIEEMITLGSHRDQFTLIPQQAVRVSDLQRILMKHQPHIVHFSGHGSESNEIVLEDDLRRSKSVPREALAALFKVLKDNVRIVVLNACFSKIQAEALGETIDFVIGMNKEIRDSLAINFAGAFYQALAFDRSIPDAFELAKIQLDLVRLLGSDTPELFVRSGADTTKSLLAARE